MEHHHPIMCMPLVHGDRSIRRIIIRYGLWRYESPGTFSNTNPHSGYFLKHWFLSQAPGIEHVGGAWKQFHPTLELGYLHRKDFWYFAFHSRRGIIIHLFKKLDSFLRVFGLLTLLYLLNISSVHFTSHFLFIIIKFIITFSSVWTSQMILL